MKFEIDTVSKVESFKDLKILNEDPNGPGGGNYCYTLEGTAEAFYAWCMETNYYEPDEDVDYIIDTHTA